MTATRPFRMPASTASSAHGVVPRAAAGSALQRWLITSALGRARTTRSETAALRHLWAMARKVRSSSLPWRRSGSMQGFRWTGLYAGPRKGASSTPASMYVRGTARIGVSQVAECTKVSAQTKFLLAASTARALNIFSSWRRSQSTAICKATTFKHRQFPTAVAKRFV